MHLAIMAFRAPGATFGVSGQKAVPRYPARLSGQSTPRGSADLLAFPEGFAFLLLRFRRSLFVHLTARSLFPEADVTLGPICDQRT